MAMAPPQSKLNDTPRSRPKHLLLFGCALLAIGLLGAASYRLIFGGPSVSVASHGTEKTVDLHFLGEYCIGISRVRLADRGRKDVIWEVVAAEHHDTGICSFKLHLGRNSVRVDQPSDLEFRVLHPVQPFFYLQKGKEYELTIWGNNGFARCEVTRRSIRF